MRFLITGATGFIGPFLIDALISRGDFCRCLVRPRTNAETIERAGVEIVRGDITKPETIEGKAEGMDAVLHLATLGHMSNFTVPEDMFHAINVQGTLNVMREGLKAGVARIVHCSSTAAMGLCDEIPSTETTGCKPHHPYGRSKLEAERAMQQMTIERGLPAVVVRFSMVYGPGEPRDMLTLVRLPRRGLLPRIGTRRKLTPLIHVSDAVQGLLLALEKGRAGEVYLITNPQPEPFDEIANILRRSLGVKRPTLYIPEWAALAAASIIEKTYAFIGRPPPVSRKNIESTLTDRFFSIDKARDELGFAPKTDTETGLREMVAWYLRNGWV